LRALRTSGQYECTRRRGQVAVLMVVVAVLVLAAMALGRDLVPGPRVYVEVGVTPIGMVEWDGLLLVQDWRTWDLSALDPRSGEVTVLGRADDNEVGGMTVDLALVGDLLYLGLSEHRDGLVGHDLTTSPLESISLHFGDIGIPEPEPFWEPHFGLEIVDNVLYMIIRHSEENRYELLEYDLTGEREARFYVLPANDEPHGLQRWGDYFITGFWGRGHLYRIEIDDGRALMRPWLDVNLMVPEEVRSPGGFRGFHIGEDRLYITTIACYEPECLEHGTGRVHILRLPSWLRP